MSDDNRTDDPWEQQLRQGLDDLARDAEPPPTLADGISDRVLARSRAPRRGALLAVAAAAVIVAGALAILLASDHGRHNVVVVSPATSTTSGGQATITTASTATLETTSTAPATTSPPISSTPTTPPSTAGTTMPPTPASTTTTTAPTPDCTTADLHTVTLVDAANGTYSRGQTVTVTVKVTNVSNKTCQITSPYPGPFGTTIQIAAQNGTTVFDPRTTVAGIGTIPQPKVLAPSASYLWTTAQWDQHSCTAPACTLNVGTESGEGPLVAPGQYTVSPAQTPPSPATSATFQIGP